MWYDLPPSERARYFRFCVENGKGKIDAFRRTPKLFPSWTEADVVARERSNRKLAAHAMIFEASEATRAGDVDDFGLSDPTMPLALEARLVDAIHAKAGPEEIELLAYRPRLALTPDRITVGILEGGDYGTGLNWCEIRSRVDPDDGSFLIYSLNGFWFGKFEPGLNQVAIDGFDEPSPATEVWRGHAPFHNHERDRAIAWINEQVTPSPGTENGSSPEISM